MTKAVAAVRWRGGVSLLVLGGFWCLATPALAQQAATPSSPDAMVLLITSLRNKGILSDEEYRTMLARLNTPSSGGSAVGADGVVTASRSGTGSAQGQVSPDQEVASAGASSPRASSPEKAVKTSLGTVQVSGLSDSGVGVQVGDVALKLHASVNGFYVHQNNSPNTPDHQVAGGTATPGQQTSAIRSGFVPGYVLLDATTQQRGWDIAAHFGFYPGLNSSAGSPNLVGVPQAFNVGGMDIRQINMTIGRPDLGTFKIGRDIGLFEQDAALNDIALLGVGTPSANPSPTNSTLGRIGSGYIYADFIPQITYTSPSLAGFRVSVGVFQPLRTFGLDETNGAPGFQYRVAYEKKINEFSATLWSSGIIQKHDATIGGIGRDYTGRGIDFGGKLGYGPFNVVGSYFTGSGLGIAGLFDSPLGTDLGKRDSHGYYVQGTYKVGKFLFGGSYGGNWLDLSDGEPVSNVVDRNTSWIGQARYTLVDWVTLIGEYTSQRSVAHDGNRATSNSIAAGAILAF